MPKYFDGNINEIIDIGFPLTIDQFPQYINFKDINAYESFKNEFIDLFDKKYYKNIKKNSGCLELLKLCKEKYGENNVFILTNRRKNSALKVSNYLNITNVINDEKI